MTVTLVAFLALTAAAVWLHGYLGVSAYQSQNLARIQVLADLVIASSIFLVWMWQDARASGRNPWPWLLLTLTTGSIGTLIYPPVQQIAAMIGPRQTTGDNCIRSKTMSRRINTYG